MEDEAEITSSAGDAERGNPPVSEADKQLAKSIRERVEYDRKHWGPDFQRMREDIEFVRLGAAQKWLKGGNYVANITGRHIKQLVSALYAKNPKAIARRRARLDFQIWDEDEQSLIAAIQIVQQYEAAMQAAAQAAMMGGNVLPGPGMDPLAAAAAGPMMGHNGGPPMMAPMVPPEVQQAQALLQDFQAGMQERMTVDKIGKTLEVLFNYYMKEQSPLDFKESMKALVRRVGTTGAGFLVLGFQRAYEQDNDVAGQISDVRMQLHKIKALMADEAKKPDEYEGETDATSEECQKRKRELEIAMESLMQQEYVLLREGLVFDWPESTRVIPDSRCTSLSGFIGCRWVSVDYFYTVDEVKGLFGIDLGQGHTRYTAAGTKIEDKDDDEVTKNPGLARVTACYDRAVGVVYHVAEGYEGFLKPPAAPDIYVESFWPVWALTFNAGEDPEHPWPLSDAYLLRSMQEEHNRSRQGKREHRRAARPRFLSRRGALDEDEKERLQEAEPFSVTEVNPTDAQADLTKLVQAIEFPGVDPNLYDTGEILNDMQMVVGSSSSGLGADARGETATGEALAEDSRALSSGSNVDDLDGFLTSVARAAGQVMLRELSAETVRKIAGRGAVWPEMTLEDLVGEVYLEIEAGSTGKPNAAQEIRNWREMLPFLIQMPGIEPTWLARESLRRLDDRLDLTDALAQGLPAIVSMNRMAQPGAMDPGASPDQQGAEGAGNGAPAPSQPSGSMAAFGNNQIPI